MIRIQKVYDEIIKKNGWSVGDNRESKERNLRNKFSFLMTHVILRDPKSYFIDGFLKTKFPLSRSSFMLHFASSFFKKTSLPVSGISCSPTFQALFRFVWTKRLYIKACLQKDFLWSFSSFIGFDCCKLKM